MLWKAGRANSESEFDYVLQEMAQINDRAPTWLLNHADPIHWAEFLFIGQRFGHLTSNIAELLNAWPLEPCEMSILMLFEDYRHKLMDWFDVRRKLEVTTPGILVSKVANEMKGLASASKSTSL